MVFFQDHFHLKHSTINHLVTLRVSFEKAWEKGNTIYVYLVDIAKIFSYNASTKLWERMEKVKILHSVDKLLYGYIKRLL